MVEPPTAMVTAIAFSHALPNQVEQIEHVLGAGTLVVDHEVGVPGAHHGAALAGALEAELVDESAGRAARGVLEDTPGVAPGGLALS